MASNTSKALKGISSQTVVTILLGLMEMVSFSIMSRILSKEDFGFYAAVNAIVMVFSSLSETGIGSAIVQRKDTTPRYINNAFTLSLLFGIGSMLVLLIAAFLLPESMIDREMRLPIMLLSVTLLLNCVSSIFRSILHKQLKFFTIGFVQLISLTITTVVAVVLALYGMGYYAIIAKAILGSALSFVIYFFLSRSHYKLLIDKETFRDIFKFSGWLMASRFFSDLSKQVDKLLMPRLMSIAILGEYTRPKDFVHTFSTKINGIFDTALFPILSSIQNDDKAMRKAYTKSLYTLNVFALLMTLAFSVNSQLIMRIFFGDEWLHLTPIFAIFSILFVFNSDGRIADCYLRSLGRTKIQFYFRIMEFVTKTIGVVIGSRWGLIGVSVGVVLMECLVKFIKVVYAGALISMPLKDILKTILLSSRFLIIFVPIIVIANIVIPQSVTGNILLLVVFSVITVVLFMLCPKIIGERYANDLYPMVKNHTKGMINKIIKK
jgi:PST family polysaccharide transporter